MRKLTQKLVKKTAPIIEKMIQWAIRTAFELLKVAGLAYMVMSQINAEQWVEAGLAAIVVFTAYYFTRSNR